MTLVDFQRARQQMVATQIQERGISDANILRVMGEIPRHRFVPHRLRHHAYDDAPLRIACGQTISQPYMVALMTTLLGLTPEDRILEIGTGSGYQSAVLASVGGVVISLERHARLVHHARETLHALNVTNVLVSQADGTLGCEECGPYDAILVTAGGPRLPESLGRQLKRGGRLVCPVGDRKVQRIVRALRTENGLETQKSIPCAFVPLIGEEGWPS